MGSNRTRTTAEELKREGGSAAKVQEDGRAKGSAALPYGSPARSSSGLRVAGSGALSYRSPARSGSGACFTGLAVPLKLVQPLPRRRMAVVPLKLVQPLPRRRMAVATFAQEARAGRTLAPLADWYIWSLICTFAWCARIQPINRDHREEGWTPPRVFASKLRDVKHFPRWPPRHL